METPICCGDYNPVVETTILLQETTIYSVETISAMIMFVEFIEFQFCFEK